MIAKESAAQHLKEKPYAGSVSGIDNFSSRSTEMIIPPFLISAGLIAFFMWLVFYSIRESKNIEEAKMSDESFVVKHTKIIAIIGIALIAILSIVVVGITISQQIQDLISGLLFYGVFGVFYLLGLLLVLLYVKCKVVIEGKNITAFFIIKKPYTFLFSDISSVVREVKRTYYGELEGMVIKTKEGRKIIAEGSQISYERFFKAIELNVNKEYLVGFEYGRDEYSMLKRNPAIIRNYVVESIKLLAGPPEMQLSAFSGRTDELAYALDGWLRVYENDSIFRRRYFSKYEYKLISDLNKSVNDLSADLFTENAIKTSPEWDEIRIQAKDVLSVLKTGQ